MFGFLESKLNSTLDLSLLSLIVLMNASSSFLQRDAERLI